jgi:DNA repair protein RadC
VKADQVCLCGCAIAHHPDVVDLVEILRVVHFDKTKAVLAINLYRGDQSRVAMPLRAIIADALRLGSAGLLLSHNHPSGDPTPSQADLSATQRLMQATRALDIYVHDHLIIGCHRQFSLRAAGLL